MNPNAVQLISEVIQIKRSFWTFDEWNVERPTLPNPPAVEEDLLILEAKSALRLPAEYRRFLAMHNGWNSVVLDTHLLSTFQILTGLGRFALRKVIEILGDGPERRIPIGVSGPEWPDFFGFFLSFDGENISDRVIEVDQYGECLFYNDIWGVLERMRDGLLLRKESD